MHWIWHFSQGYRSFNYIRKEIETLYVEHFVIYRSSCITSYWYCLSYLLCQFSGNVNLCFLWILGIWTLASPFTQIVRIREWYIEKRWDWTLYVIIWWTARAISPYHISVLQSWITTCRVSTINLFKYSVNFGSISITIWPLWRLTSVIVMKAS